ncbi:hypothetical protein [Arthrobacter sp. VKM Ac-2550]|uniref:hypothetical protein n=1 Tax=Crystallibacter permensis TaxID=1938888 RepID=UPI002225E6FC|nr:hypothetical protein [Arthrobacter sp. VKM Ac-2550]MCW2134127.1 hypothetical protein [Arthrobacter sp. VKM Ac-2550]
MGLTETLARLAVRATRILVVEAPGQWQTRVELEQQMLRLGWRPAWTPGDADVLAVCGAPGPELAQLVERLWEQMPGPRVRAAVTSPTAVTPALNDAAALLLDTPAHRTDAQERAQKPQIPAVMDHGGHGEMGHHGIDHSGMNHGGHDGMDHTSHGGMDQGQPGDEDHRTMKHEDHHGTDHSSMNHGGHDGMDHGSHRGMDHGDTDQGQPGDEDHHGMNHSGMNHGGHGEMDHSSHGGMDMAPEGIPLAQGGEDRDGLGVDVLHLPLGPVLPFWPAGLVLHCSLQGDVVVAADAAVVDGGSHADGIHSRHSGLVPAAAVRCDNLVALLTLIGTQDLAARARSARDALLHGDPGGARGAVERLHRVVRRSIFVRWSLRGVLPLAPADLERHGLPDRCLGDAYDRVLSLVERVRAEVNGANPGAPVGAERVPWGMVPHLVTGLEIGTVRLAVASLDLDPFPAVHEVGHA